MKAPKPASQRIVHTGVHAFQILDGRTVFAGCTFFAAQHVRVHDAAGDHDGS